MTDVSLLDPYFHSTFPIIAHPALPRSPSQHHGEQQQQQHHQHENECAGEVELPRGDFDTMSIESSSQTGSRQRHHVDPLAPIV